MKTKSAFTLIELLIVITIIAILVIGALMSVNTQRDKASDTKSKSELNRLKIAFEEYYNDHNCYPPAEWFDSLDDCGGGNLKPYLGSIPCDPTTNLPYPVEYEGGACGTSFKLYAHLKSIDDPSVTSLCSEGGSTLGNYGVGSSNVTVSIDCTTQNISTPTPIPLPSTIPGQYACTPQGACNAYSAQNIVNYACPVTFNSGEIDSPCVLYCATPTSARCTN